MGILLWPFQLIWGLISFLFGLMGAVISIVAAIVTIILGVILTITLIGSFMGIPLIILGALLLLKTFFGIL